MATSMSTSPVKTSYSCVFRADVPQSYLQLFTVQLVGINIIFYCNWVDTQWQQYSTHLHTNSTQNKHNERTIHNKNHIAFGSTLITHIFHIHVNITVHYIHRIREIHENLRKKFKAKNGNTTVLHVYLLHLKQSTNSR
jgi:hypothetical protein